MSKHKYKKPLAILFAVIITTSAMVQPVAAAPGQEDLEVRIYTAASLTNAISDIAAQYQQQHPEIHITPVFSASSTLARQIEAGAPADIFFSADWQWIDYLAEKKLLDNIQIKPLLGNTLVVISPKNRAFDFRAEAGFDFAAAFDGHLCTGQMASVPVGRYARESLVKLGWLDALQGRIVETDDVRAALAFVERGECAAGIVYATDAAISRNIEVVGSLPADSYTAVIYPVALTTQASGKPAAQQFLRYIESHATASAIFVRYGFRVLPVSP